MSSIENLITVADLDKYPDDDGNRYELIEGDLFVSCAPGIPHQLVLQNVQLTLYAYLQKNAIGKLVPGAGVVLSNFDAVVPDLVVVRNHRWNEIVLDNLFVAAPDLVIEVLSPGNENRKRDFDSKHRLYGKFGVDEYWIVDPEKRCVIIYRLGEGILNEVATCNERDKILSKVLPELDINVCSLFQIE